MYNPKKFYNRLSLSWLYRKYPEYPVYIFHHIPKCGGTSLLRVFGKWFKTVHDYRDGWNNEERRKVDVSKLKCIHCLCGHFDHDGIFLYQRYPEVLNNSNIRVITFLRDPLHAKLSLYRYEKKKRGVTRSLEEHLFSRLNYLSNCFPVSRNNYKEVLDSYFFVGVVERMQDCINYLSAELGKKPMQVPVVNSTVDCRSPAFNKQGVTVEMEERFKKENELDYVLYYYACELVEQRIGKPVAIES